MSWNYRMIRKSGFIEIHEVYYDKNGKPNGCTVDSCSPGGETVEEIKQELEYYQKALTLPVLEYSYFENLGKNTKNIKLEEDD